MAPQNLRVSARELIFAAIVLLLGSIALHWPHIGPKLADVNFDLYIHYNWAREFVDNFGLQSPYPRWTFNASFGLGEPAFVFYSPLYYMSVALVAAATGLNTWYGMQIVAVLANTVFAWFVYRSARYYVSAKIAIAVGIVALFSPFLGMLHYKFHGLAWATLGYASHGFLLWALIRPNANKHWINLPAALAIGLAVCSHTISGLVNLISFSAVVFVPVLMQEQGKFRAFTRACISWAGTAGLGLALSCVYLLPALHFLPFIHTTAWTGTHILQAFAWPTFTIFMHGVQWWSFQWPIAVPALLLALLPMVYLFVYRRQQGLSRELSLLLLTALASIFFASELSYPLWSFDWALTKIQLPYRFLSVLFVVGAVATGLVLQRALLAGQTGWATGAAILLTANAALGGILVFKASYLDGTPVTAEIQSGDYSFRPLERRFHESDFAGKCAPADRQCEAMLQAGGGYRGIPEYVTRWRGPSALDYARGGLEAECARIEATCSPWQPRGTQSQVDVTVQADRAIVLPIYHFPGWTVQVDGAPVEHSIDPATGLIRVDLKSGKHAILVTWQPTPVERLGRQISGGAALILLALALWRWRKAAIK